MNNFIVFLSALLLYYIILLFHTVSTHCGYRVILFVVEDIFRCVHPSLWDFFSHRLSIICCVISKLLFCVASLARLQLLLKLAKYTIFGLFLKIFDNRMPYFFNFIYARKMFDRLSEFFRQSCSQNKRWKRTSLSIQNVMRQATRAERAELVWDRQFDPYPWNPVYSQDSLHPPFLLCLLHLPPLLSLSPLPQSPLLPPHSSPYFTYPNPSPTSLPPFLPTPPRS